MTNGFVEPIERAIKDDRVTALAVALGALRAAGAFDADGFFPQPKADRYARKLLWSDSKGRFIIVGMTWAPGQSAPLHDHAGRWGGEIVVSGTMTETVYDLREERDSLWRFEAQNARLSQPGDVGLLTPPYEYHAFGNAGSVVARTLHVYAGTLDDVRCFQPVRDDWYSATSVHLAYDA